MGLLASCTKEMDTPESTGGKTVLTVGIGSETRTYMGETTTGTTTTRKVYWSPKDQIAVNGTPSDPLPDDLADETASASFSFDGIISAPYNLLYPASIYKDASHVTLPAVQAYKADGFAKDMFPMAGTGSSAADLSISHLCAILKISVLRATGNEADADKIVAVRFKGRNNEKVSGDFEIDYATPQLVPAAKNSDVDGEVRVAKSLATSTSNAVVYYLVVPARTYANGFDIIVQDEQGHIMTQSKTTEWVAVPGKQINMPEFTFVPTGTELGIEISNAEELIAFATAYNAEEYKALDSQLIATVTDNIVFDATSSAAFNATGGIGTHDNGKGDTNYFNGVFNGNGHTISGYTGISPIFAYTGSNGIVKDLTLAADCDKTIPADASGELFGAFVGYHKGRLENCTSHADLSISNIANKGHFYGGLVGRNHGGQIVGCTMDGDVNCPATLTLSAAANQAGIGGIAGRSNSTSSKIEDCHFNGNITIGDGSDFGGISGVKGVVFFIGGIVGHLQEGSVTGCDTQSGKTLDVRGTFNAMVGGIAGSTEQSKPASISGCTNNMTVSFSSNGGRSVITPTMLAGIVGNGAGASVSNCENNGSVTSYCNANLLYIGGIAALGDDGTFTGCHNFGNVSQTNQVLTAQAARYIFMGGIVAIFTNGATKASTVKECKNYASIICNQLGTSTAQTVDMGGIVGRTESQAVTIIDCKNLKNGLIRVIDSANKVAYPRTNLGGILGSSPIASTSISGCYNSAKIHCQYTQGGTNNRPSYLGGIVGMLGDANGVDGLEIKDCHNTGCVQNQNYNNTVTMAGAPIYGGIVGVIVGTEEIKAKIEDCTSSSPSPNDSIIMGQRGISGGIAGYVKLATVKDNTASCTLSGNSNAIGAGGIVGWMEQSSMTGCTFSGFFGATTGTNVAPRNVGGLVYLMDGESSITGNCKVDGATLNKGTHASATDPAVLVNEAAEGATITGCGVKGTLEGAAITLSSRMITTNNGANLSGTYLLD